MRAIIKFWMNTVLMQNYYIKEHDFKLIAKRKPKQESFFVMNNVSQNTVNHVIVLLD